MDSLGGLGRGGPTQEGAGWVGRVFLRVQGAVVSQSVQAKAVSFGVGSPRLSDSIDVQQSNSSIYII